MVLAAVRDMTLYQGLLASIGTVPVYFVVVVNAVVVVVVLFVGCLSLR